MFLGPRQWSTDLRTTVETIDLIDSNSYRLCGETLHRSPSSSLVESLTRHLYQHVYMRSRQLPVMAPLAEINSAALFRQHLLRVEEGRFCWQSGWRLREILPDARCIVERGGIRFHSPLSDVRHVEETLKPGDAISVRIPGDAPNRLPGFYSILGTTDSPSSESPWLLRLYWNLNPDCATTWLEQLCQTLDPLGISFKAKVPDDPSAYGRADAGVLYLQSGCWATVALAIAELYRAVEHGLHEATPCFTLPLAPGLAVAEGPLGGESFGEHRCELIASALVEAFTTGQPKEETVDTAFRTAGLDPAKPYRAPRSQACYPLPGIRRASRRHEPHRKPSPASLSQCALGIGLDLCQEANWYQGRCNWLSRCSPSKLDGWGGYAAVCTLPAEMHDGTSGVALFLAELFLATREERLRDTLLGLLQQTLWQAERAEPGAQDLSPFGGLAGHLWATRHCANRLGDDNLTAQVDQHLDAFSLEEAIAPEADRPVDFISGDSGTIPMLLELYNATGFKRLRRAALALGDQLCESAETADGCWIWPGRYAAVHDEDGPAQLGLSHGNAGVGLALLHLYRETGEIRFLEGARGAFAYEDRQFSAAVGNWPDLRSPGVPSPEANRESTPPRYRVAWCHGAPGIALARLRALQLNPEGAEYYLPAARAGVTTAAETLRARLRRPNLDTTLCHGLCGLVETLLVAAEVLGELRYRHLAEGALRCLAERYAGDNQWPSGVSPRFAVPGLMLGSAGVGYTFLRAANPKLRSILVF